MGRMTDHYRQTDLIERIERQLVAAGIQRQSLQARTLSGMDEFHLGGAAATTALLADMDLADDARVLDVGSGAGGVARRLVAGTNRHVLGIDLTPEFVDLANHLTALTGLADRATFRIGDVTALDFEDASVDAVTMLHVGMNIDDKSTLFGELARIVRPGGVVGIYDIMRIGEGDIEFPVPWSSGPATSFVAPPSAYTESMARAGLSPEPPVDRTRLVREALAGSASSPLPLDLSHLMGPGWPVMFSNLRAALDAGILAPVQVIGHRT